ncbi:MAG: DUF1983 domain-containing protein, partial [Moraxella sp.]|nr:DUF1983 domain-containing protein [Moraxella sp.]
RGRIVDKLGNTSDWTAWAKGTTDASADKVLDILAGQIGESELNTSLTTSIGKIPALDGKVTGLDGKVTGLDGRLTASEHELTTKINADVASTRTALNKAISDVNNGLTTKVNELSNTDKSLLATITANKQSTDSSIAAVLTKTETALSKTTQNASTLTAVQAGLATKNRTYRQSSAPTANLVVGDLWINTTGGKNMELRRWGGKTWDTTADPRIASNVSAISGLSTKVASAEGQISQHGQHLTTINNELATVKNELGSKANSSAVSALDSKLTGIDGKLTSESSKITKLQNDLTTTNKTVATKANTTALTTLDSKVTGIDGRLTATTTKTDRLSAKFDGLSVGGRNLLFMTANNYASYGSGATFTKSADFARIVALTVSNKGLANSFKSTHTLKQGEKAVLSFEYRTDMPNLHYTYILNDNGNWAIRPLLSAVSNGEWQKAVISFVAPKDLTNVRALVGGVAVPVGAFLELKNLKLERGTIATDWTPAPEDGDSAVQSVQANLDSFKATTATKDTATATKISTLQTTVGNHTSSIQQHSQSLNGLSAQWTLKVQTGNIVSGIGLASSNGVSDLAVRADKFFIAAPTGTNKGKPPFIVKTTSSVVNGVTVPAGTYIDSAFIANASINMAKIDKASISSLSALSANIGHFKSAETGARLEIKDSLLSVYDENNRLRVRLGLW